MLDAKEITQVFWKILWTVAYLAIIFGIYMLVLCMHQNIEKRRLSLSDHPKPANGYQLKTSQRE